MTSDERNMLTDLASKFAQTPAPPKDPESEEFIRTKIGNRPDALYMMTQTVLIQNLAIQHAQQQIQDLQGRAGQPLSSGGSFLGGGSQGASAPRNPGYAQSGNPQYAAPQPQYAPPAGSPGGAPSFLKGAAQTAAGVAAGALAFEGIQSLFSHPGYGGGGFGGFGGGGFGGGLGGAPVEETVVNNYYDDNQGGGGNDVQNIADNQGFDDSGNSGFDDGGGGGFDGGGGDNFS